MTLGRSRLTGVMHSELPRAHGGEGQGLKVALNKEATERKCLF